MRQFILCNLHYIRYSFGVVEKQLYRIGNHLVHPGSISPQSLRCARQTSAAFCSVVRYYHSSWPPLMAKKRTYPPLVESDLEESYTHGSGPGGQSVNKTTNCVNLKHIPTGVLVKCHETRSLEKNRERARVRLQERLDWHFNKENSQIEVEKAESSKERKRKKNKTNERLEKLKAFKEREGLS